MVLNTKMMRKVAMNDITDWHQEVIELCDTVDFLVKLLDESDSDDAFGPEGWRHYSGIEEII